jgi:septal ring factor EnvC (AmiA/AmiB activator)
MEPNSQQCTHDFVGGECQSCGTVTPEPGESAEQSWLSAALDREKELRAQLQEKEREIERLKGDLEESRDFTKQITKALENRNKELAASDTRERGLRQVLNKILDEVWLEDSLLCEVENALAQYAKEKK